MAIKNIIKLFKLSLRIKLFLILLNQVLGTMINKIIAKVFYVLFIDYHYRLYYLFILRFCSKL